MEKTDYKKQVKNLAKITGVKKKISGSYGIVDYYKYYKENGGELSMQQFSKVVQKINIILAELYASGKDIVFPYRMGTLELRKFKTKAYYSNGELKITYPVDWDATLSLWEKDKEAEEKKTLIRREVPYVFRTHYRKYNACFKNRPFFYFSVTRTVKKLLKNQINTGKIDAFLFT